MAMLGPANFRRPKNLHEIAGLRRGEVIKVFSQVHLVKQSSGAGPVGIPPAPDAFAIALVANQETLERGMVQGQGSAGAKGFDCLDENQIGRAGTITGRSSIRHDEKNALFKMSSRLQSNRRHPRSGIMAARGHGPDLIDDEAVVAAGSELGLRRAAGANQNKDGGQELSQSASQTNRS